MLSRVPSQPRNGITKYRDYTPRVNPIHNQSHSKHAVQTNPQSNPTENLQAGRKRRESEIDTSDPAENASVRRRISRACDQCNQLRTKCDGKTPCAHCVDSNLSCKYARAHKKRGRAPKKEQDQAEDINTNGSQKETPSPETGTIPPASEMDMPDAPYKGGEVLGDDPHQMNRIPSGVTMNGNHQSPYYGGYDHSTTMAIPTSNHMPDMQQPMVPQLAQSQGLDFSMPPGSDFTASNFNPMHLPTNGEDFGFPMGDDYSVAFMGKAPMVESPDWLALTSPMFLMDSTTPQSRTTDALRFPVLLPLLPHIESIIPQTLACDLLERYFASSTSVYLRPSNPYVLGSIFRKRSILHPTDPRPCSPALLASMLWLAAQTSDITPLTNQPDTRARICQKLLELTVNLLKPLIHNQPSISKPPSGFPQMPVRDAGLGALVEATTQTGGKGVDRMQIDNLATYFHLATVVSASERKAASLRWWHAAWSLAREMRLGRELPPNPPEIDGDKKILTHGNEAITGHGVDGFRKPSLHDSQQKNGFVSEEDREERRRMWWLLYMQDRHLAFCYNRPMFFLNKECESLLQPLDENTWQMGRFEQADAKYRRLGLNIECTSHSTFGYFLPLMIILGEILDLNHARSRPRFGPRAHQRKNWDEQTDEITQQLETYGRSLQMFEATGGYGIDLGHQEAVAPSMKSSGSNDSYGASELALQTKIVTAYGTHIMHVLHILLTGKWDPIALLDDNDLWISSQAFVNATGHAVSAAEAVAEIIEHDPDLSFMPFFFGVYLFQGSFLLLLFADKLQGDVSPDVVKACETIVRAHEVCVATLDTQYQRNFRKVMRSALQQVRGRIPVDSVEQRHWRREILALYRWTGDGTGLAL